MPYSDVSICNMALIRAGGKGTITSLTESTDVARKVNAFYEAIRDEVLAYIKPKFAVTRVELAKNATAPANGYLYAYALPSDYVSRVDDRPGKPAVQPEGWQSAGLVPAGSNYYSVAPGTVPISYPFPYEIERTSDDVLCLVTDYDNTSSGLFLTYVKQVTDPTQFTASFVNALTFRLSAEFVLSVGDAAVTRYQLFMQLYEEAAKQCITESNAQDYLSGEVGSETWLRAGR